MNPVAPAGVFLACQGGLGLRSSPPCSPRLPAQPNLPTALRLLMKATCLLNGDPKVKHSIWALSLLSASCVLFTPARAQDAAIVPGLTYVCNGERLHIDSCNIRDLSDSSTCMVAHPDHMRPNGFPEYTYETRGNLKKLLPTCQQPTAQQKTAATNAQQRQQATVDANIKKAEASPPMPTRADVVQALQPRTRLSGS